MTHRFGAPVSVSGVKVHIRVAESLGPTFAQAFDDFTLRTETVISGDIEDDAALHGLLARIRDLGIAMLDVHVEGRRGSDAGERVDIPV